MKRHLLLAARLYPRAWRERYGAEFEALVEDVRPTWRNVADIYAGALKTHMKIAGSYWQFAGILAAAGVFLGAAASYTITPRYVSNRVAIACSVLLFGVVAAALRKRRRALPAVA